MPGNIQQPPKRPSVSCSRTPVTRFQLMFTTILHYQLQGNFMFTGDTVEDLTIELRDTKLAKRFICGSTARKLGYFMTNNIIKPNYRDPFPVGLVEQEKTSNPLIHRFYCSNTSSFPCLWHVTYGAGGSRLKQRVQMHLLHQITMQLKS